MLSHLPYMVLRRPLAVALAALLPLAALAALLALAIFFCSKANLIPANNKADIRGVRLTPPTDLGRFLIAGLLLAIFINSIIIKIN
jgi:hypothetical protein